MPGTAGAWNGVCSTARAAPGSAPHSTPISPTWRRDRADPDSVSAQRGCGIAQPAGDLPRSRLAALCAICALLAAPAFAQEQGGAALLERLAGDEGEGALVRAEAALILAHLAPERAEAACRAAAAARDPRARAVGMLALGVLAPPGAEVLLGRAFADDRDETVRLAAAHGLGLLPGGQPAPALDRYLTRIDGGNYRRHRDALAAIVAGMARTPHPARRAWLRRLLDDEANRDAGLRALAIHALARAGDRPEAAEIRERLEAEDPIVRLAAVLDLGGDPEAAAAHTETLASLAGDDADPRVRAGAVDALVRARRPAALAVADRALRAAEGSDLAAGVQAATELGGGPQRDELAAQIAAEPDPGRRAAMLGAWRGRVPPVLADAAFTFAADRSQDLAARALATHVLARAGDERAVPLLRLLVVDGDEGDLLALLIEDLARLGADGDLSERLGPAADGARQHLAPRLEALFRLGRPEAVEVLAEALGDERLGAGARAELLRAWRRALMSAPDPAWASALPPALLALLR
jgi:hypothetical protein